MTELRTDTQVSVTLSQTLATFQDYRPVVSRQWSKDGFQQEYIKEQMLKQYVMLYLAEGKYEMFGSEFTEMEPPEAADAVIQKVEKIYWNSLK